MPDAGTLLVVISHTPMTGVAVMQTKLLPLLKLHQRGIQESDFLLKY